MIKLKCKENNTQGLLVTIVMSFLVNSSSYASSSIEPTVKLYKVDDIKPMVQKGHKFLESGMSVHRRVINLPKDGSRFIDVGYNNYKAGVGATGAYAYDKAELCYVSTGEIYAKSYDEEILFKTGHFMYRPPFAITHATKVLTDSVTVCAFAPARLDNWSHKQNKEQIMAIEADPNHPVITAIHQVDIADTAPSRPGADKHAKGMAVHKRMITKAKDGSELIDASYNVYKAGLETTDPYAYTVDEVCWLESGKVEMINRGSEGKKEIVNAGDFMWRPAGAVTEYAMVLEDTVSICFFAPARGSDWGIIATDKLLKAVDH